MDTEATITRPSSVLKDLLRNWFNFPNQPLFCQVGTVFDDKPHMRTMALYDVLDDNDLIFLSRTDTAKWRDLSLNQHVAVILFNADIGQLVVEGLATKDTLTTNRLFTEHYWEKLSADAKMIYFSSSEPRSDLIVPPWFGVISIQPMVIDVLTLQQPNYLQNSRKIFRRQNENWLVEDALLL